MSSHTRQWYTRLVACACEVLGMISSSAVTATAVVAVCCHITQSCAISHCMLVGMHCRSTCKRKHHDAILSPMRILLRTIVTATSSS